MRRAYRLVLYGVGGPAGGRGVISSNEEETVRTKSCPILGKRGGVHTAQIGLEGSSEGRWVMYGLGLGWG